MTTLPESPGVPLIDGEAGGSPAPPIPVADRGSRLLLGASLVLIAFNLRPVFSSLSTVLPEVMRDLALAPATASLLTTLPVLCLGLFAPLAPVAAARYGTERVIGALLVALAAGTALRGVASLSALFAGSVLAGGSIALVNVLLPGLVKRDFPNRAGLMTGLFTMGLCAGAAAAAAFTVPLEKTLGASWPEALAAWAAPALVVALVWLPQAIRAAPVRHSEVRPTGGLWRDRLAWHVTLFMGLQSALAYSIFGWLAPILRERGIDAATAGFVLSMSVVAQMAASLVTPTVALRGRDQRAIALALLGLALAGLLGLMFAPLALVWPLALLQGVGQGGLFAVAVTIIILRAPDSRVAARLSGMAQGVGYVLAALGPLLVGAIRGWTGGFGAAAVLFVALAAGAGIAAWDAGRVGQVGGA